MNNDYRKGFEDGVRCFAWWKDGVQMVGTTGTTLERALAGVENRHGFNPPKQSAGAVYCSKCGNFLPGHATGAADICTCL